MPPMQASRCNGSGCDYGNGLVSPTNPLTYDGRLLSPLSTLKAPWDADWVDECGVSQTGEAARAVPAAAQTVGSPETMQWTQDSFSVATSVVSSPTSSIEITGTDNMQTTRSTTRRTSRFHSYSHPRKRAGARTGSGSESESGSGFA
ncbi:hypothetical protein SPBR_05390 [Sporothrix brasiliensis 5110]|uniref:Uncharacterized protein n=1 Tax=Sporothrix brasiliensis 5110 TaxID=1398154 RepID=A0A0C2IDY8_9PEZI|nr:uncharacterized protein SPBR_05390 [Sporothrix brasiliensis 5110]KIH87496.1 hypothetical protein SPBR_05390 [Sporothrix brasiliensis 5110]